MSADQRDPKESSSAETPPYYTRIRLEDHPHMRDVEIRLREATEAVAVIKENIKTLQEEDRKHLESKGELLRKLDNLTGVDSGIERQMASTTSSLDTLKKFIIPLISIEYSGYEFFTLRNQ